MNEFLQKLKAFAVKYREWLVVALLLGCIVYFLSLYQNLTYKQIEGQILEQRGPAQGEKAELIYDEIVNEIMVVPTPYIDLVKFNPFIDIEVILEIQRELQEKFDEGRRLYDAGNFLDAREIFRELLRKDPYEARVDYRPYKPNTYIRRCEQEALRKEIRGIYDQAIELLERARALDVPEAAANEEELLRNYEDCQNLLRTVVQRGQELLPEAVEDAEKKLEGSDEQVGVNQRVRELQMFTFTVTLTRLYEDAVGLWNRGEESLSNVANAKENLRQARQVIADYPGELPDSVFPIQDQVERLLGEIDLDVERRYPYEKLEADELVSTGQGNLDKLTQALDKYKVLYRLQEQDEVREQIDQLEQTLGELRKEQMQQQARGWLEQARALWEQAGKARDDGDYDALAAAKRDGLSVLAQFDGLPETPEWVQLRAEAANVRSDFEKLAVPPLITGYNLIYVSERSARLEEVATKIRIPLTLGREDRRSGITYDQPGETDPAGRIMSVILKKNGFRPTEIRLGQP